MEKALASWSRGNALGEKVESGNINSGAATWDIFTVSNCPEVD